ncbi:DUF2203 domain-containing protein [Paenibacillus alkalitolerans]|uniref:DUF2203 domain-containing protein n=1 Tax=Paenibacillus alkalitolerans TaxID=2799335 RepID=UPI0018F74F97|nr:DUF2203 domain-containing protein [Paenibacillus alkalitolerans]
MNRRYFTPREANELLPFVIEDIRRLQEAKQAFVTKSVELRELRIQARASGGEPLDDKIFQVETEMEFLQLEAKTLVDSIKLKGAELKDIDMGLVDFPATIDGEEVLLCWKMGEERITFYHGMDDGYRGRKPIPEGDV